MNDRERLIELIDDALAVYDVIVYARLNADEIADHLIANGVTVQKHGRWERKVDENDCEYAMCSCCGDEFYDPDGEDTIDCFMDYCPNCGAKMDVEGT